MEVVGNEKADEEAKRAALEQIAGESPLQHRLKWVQDPKINEDTDTSEERLERRKAKARQHRKMTRPQRFKTGVQLYGDLPREQLANLVRLRTGYCRRNSYLNRCNIIRDPACDCGRGAETAKHFLLMQKSRGTKERVEQEGGGKKHEKGDPARRSKSSEAHAGICREYRVV